jgi:hypothetical protein
MQGGRLTVRIHTSHSRTVTLKYCLADTTLTTYTSKPTLKLTATNHCLILWCTSQSTPHPRIRDGATLFKAATCDKVVVFCADLFRLPYHYDMQAVVRNTLETYILTCPGVWKDVAKRPLFYLMQGYHLRSNDPFTDAMKRAIGMDLFSTKPPYHSYGHEVSMDIVSEEVLETARVGSDKLAEEFTELRRDLQSATFILPYYCRKRSKGVEEFATLIVTRIVQQYLDAASFTFSAIPVDRDLASFVELNEVCEAGDLDRAMRRDPGSRPSWM